MKFLAIVCWRYAFKILVTELIQTYKLIYLYFNNPFPSGLRTRCQRGREKILSARVKKNSSKETVSSGHGWADAHMSSQLL